MKSSSHRQIFLTLILIIFLSGVSQGMLLPLLSILLEERGISAGLNGLNGSALYLGILAGAPFMEKNLYRFGFKPLLVTGTLVVALAVAVLPLTHSYWAWLGLRFSIGLFNHVFHYASVVWMTLIAPDNRRGRYLSYYGFSFGLGFAVGPFLANLRSLSLVLPFYLTAGLTLASCALVLCLAPTAMEGSDDPALATSVAQRARKVLCMAWFALLPGLGYGIMESAISGSFPIFLARSGLGGTRTSWILFVFFLSGLITQLPLGRLSDRLGRRKTLIILVALGGAAFLAAALLPPTLVPILACFALAGGALGSTYSLGVTYLADAIPKSLLPTGNALSSMSFGVGSLLGPFLGGLFIQYLPGIHLSWFLALVFVLIFAGLVRGRPRAVQPA